jgi:hypothetical protein
MDRLWEARAAGRREGECPAACSPGTGPHRGATSVVRAGLRPAGLGGPRAWALRVGRVW